MNDSTSDQPSSSQLQSEIQPSEEKEHWSVRLKKIPLPCGRTYEDLEANKWKPWHSCPNPNPAPPVRFLRRSQRIFKKKPEDCVLYPPYYGQGPSNEVPIKPRRRSRRRRTPLPTPSPQLVHFTDEEKKEMLRELENNSDTLPSYSGDDYDCPDSYVATCPLLTEINDATLAIVGWVDGRKDAKDT